MKQLIKILQENNIKYEISDYAGHKSIIIKKNKYKIEIYKDKKGFVSDIQKIPYTWGIMGSTTKDNIIKDFRDYLNIDLLERQLTLF